MHTSRKIGIAFILIFTVTLALCIVKHDSIPLQLFVTLVIISAVGLPFGLSLLAINNKTNTVKNTYLFISLFFLATGLTFKFAEFPSASIQLIIGILLFSFTYSPIQLKHKYFKWLPYTKSKFESFLLATIDYIGITILSIGVLSKIQWWPFANFEIYLGSIILLIGLFSWNFKFKTEIVRRKLAEDKVKEQIHEINDSINYAKRIQSAILPPLKNIQKELPHSFIMYNPKDVVAGDFYWFEKKENTVLIAAADCTGHGVPGALVSVICNNSLNRSFREYGLTKTNEILDKTREIVITEFEKSEEEVKDGMDISMASLSFHTVSEKEQPKATLEWSGANNPIWIFRKNSNEMEEIKGDKQPIGKHSAQKAFTQHTTQLFEGDTFYLFTDGFADQFGGSKGKKFMYKPFKDLLLSIQEQSMPNQKIELETALNNWKGKFEQVDDICIIGVRI